MINEVEIRLYDNNDVEITEKPFDRLYHIVQKYELNNGIINPMSPTQFVGWPDDE